MPRRDGPAGRLYNFAGFRQLENLVAAAIRVVPWCFDSEFRSAAFITKAARIIWPGRGAVCLQLFESLLGLLA